MSEWYCSKCGGSNGEMFAVCWKCDTHVIDADIAFVNAAVNPYGVPTGSVPRRTERDIAVGKALDEYEAMVKDAELWRELARRTLAVDCVSPSICVWVEKQVATSEARATVTESKSS